MKWYSVRLLFETLHDGEPHPDGFFEDRLVLVQAASESDARTKSEAYAAGEESEYENEYGEAVSDRFLEILDVEELIDDEITDLTEVYSTFLNRDEVNIVRASLKPTSADSAWPGDALRSANSPTAPRKSRGGAGRATHLKQPTQRR